MDRIVITGMGAISALGIGKEDFWEGMVAGRNAITEIESFDTREYRTHRGGEVKGFRPAEGTEGIGRASQFAIHAAREALADAGLNAAALPACKVPPVTSVGPVYTLAPDKLFVPPALVTPPLPEMLPPSTRLVPFSCHW